jgi:hypothetical protein
MKKMQGMAFLFYTYLYPKKAFYNIFHLDQISLNTGIVDITSNYNCVLD